jgi:hypothetical protein
MPCYGTSLIWDHFFPAFLFIFRPSVRSIPPSLCPPLTSCFVSLVSGVWFLISALSTSASLTSAFVQWSLFPPPSSTLAAPPRAVGCELQAVSCRLSRVSKGPLTESLYLSFQMSLYTTLQPTLAQTLLRTLSSTLLKTPVLTTLDFVSLHLTTGPLVHSSTLCGFCLLTSPEEMLQPMPRFPRTTTAARHTPSGRRPGVPVYSVCCSLPFSTWQK